MYKLTKKFFSSSVLIALFFSSNVIIADNATPSDVSIKKLELTKNLFPVPDEDIDIVIEGIEYDELPPRQGEFAPTLDLKFRSGPLYSLANSVFISKDNDIKYINIAREVPLKHSEIGNLKALKGLALTTRNISNGKKLYLPSSLKYLLIRSPIEEISGNLNALKYAYIRNDGIKKIPCFSTMSNLEHLEIIHTGIETLHLGDTPAPQLRELEFIYNKQFKGTLDITQFKNLEKAFLRGQTPIAPVDISTLTKLNRLVLDTPLTDKGIVLPTNLVHLDYTCQNCSQTPDISQLKNLTYARFSGPEFTGLPNIPAPEKLEELHLENTSITTIQGLEKFTNLKRLSINTSQIRKIENLEQLPQLTYLSLSGNQISKIENIKKLVNLDTLNLEENPITTVDFTEFDHLGGALIKLYGTPYDDTMSTDDYRKFSKLARQKRTPEKSQ